LQSLITLNFRAIEIRPTHSDASDNDEDDEPEADPQPLIGNDLQ